MIQSLSTKTRLVLTFLTLILVSFFINIQIQTTLFKVSAFIITCIYALLITI
ncbi:MAG: hypothetical protein Rsou_1799 [Candidatus Ruthia sp. Asou_11_S2]|nr:hypothetical protein [Candidatus Ruthia sp. Asou_11_S2]